MTGGEDEMISNVKQRENWISNVTDEKIILFSWGRKKSLFDDKPSEMKQKHVKRLDENIVNLKLQRHMQVIESILKKKICD